MRHWRKAPVVVNAAPLKDTATTVNAQNTAWPELPMPRDSQLYSPMSQALLRAARMGQVNKPTPPPMEDEKEAGEEEEPDGEPDAGFLIRRWTLVPKHLEGPEPEFLAKRRKGLPSFYTGTMGPTGTPGNMRKTKIQKVDSEGVVSVWDVLVPEGQTVEGEILEEEPIMTEAPAPGTVVEGVGVVNSEGVVIAGDPMLPTPTRRKPPPPKRKGKGPAKGKRKRVGFVSISKGGPPAKPTGGHLAVAPTGSYMVKPLNLSRDAANGAASSETGGADTPMHDGEEGADEGSEDDEDGEEGEGNDREEGEISPSPSISRSPSKPPAPNISGPGADLNHDIPALLLSPHVTVPPVNRDLSSSPDLPLAAATHNHAFQHTPAPLIRIEPAPDAISTPIPAVIEDIPTSQRLSVAEPPAPEAASAHAEIPAEHDPLDGLTAPTIPSSNPLPWLAGQDHENDHEPVQVPEPEPEPHPLPQHQPEQSEQPEPQPQPQSQQQQHPVDELIVRFPDGEEDLLGSLERSLGRRGEGEVTMTG